MTKPTSALRAPYDFDRQDKHGMEREYFKSFQRLEPDIQSGKVIDQAGDGPGPDIRVQMGGRLIGVEVTTVRTPLGRSDIESTADRILNEACSRAERLNLPPARVSLFFNLRRPLGEADRNRIAQAVVQVVADNMPADGDMAVADLEFRQGQPPEVDLIQVSRQSPGKFGRWSAGPEFLPTDQNISGIVQDRISAKAGRLQTYGGCDEYWLLLVADSFRASGKLALAEAVKLNTFSSPFKRTYISDFGRGHLYQLNDDDGLFTMKP